MRVQEREMTVAQATVMGWDEDGRSGWPQLKLWRENHWQALGNGLIVGVWET